VSYIHIQFFFFCFQTSREEDYTKLYCILQSYCSVAHHQWSKKKFRFVFCQAQDDCKWRQIPAFGDWNVWDGDMPVTQYFQAGAFFFAAPAEKGDADLFKVPQLPAKPYGYKKVKEHCIHFFHQLPSTVSYSVPCSLH
jgi:hypothetical protein